jgi:ATP-dependent DNA helicase RecG
VLKLSDEVTKLRGVGPRRAAVLASAGILTVEDLLLNLPFRYEDRSATATIAGLEPGPPVTVRAMVKKCRVVRGRRWRARVEATVADESGELRVVWFNQPYIAGSATPGTEVWLFGSITTHEDELQMVNPVLEAAATDSETAEGAGGSPLHVGRLVPIYRRIADLGPGLQRRLIATALEADPVVDDVLPSGTRARLQLMDRSQALRQAHDPPESADPEQWNATRSEAQRRLILEELLAFQTTLLMQRPRREGAGQEAGLAGIPEVGTATGKSEPAAAAGGAGLLTGAAELREILSALPFDLTPGQAVALDTILRDMERSEPMHRLLQGDVGCGKTAVAACAMLLTALRGRQAALLVPTEILASQQAVTLSALAAGFGLQVACVTSSQPPGERRTVENAVEAGEIALVVGTHAILQDRFRFRDLALAIVDEQHRFGVRQRAALREKGVVTANPPGSAPPAGNERGGGSSQPRSDGDTWTAWPDLLVMTATPIPRSLALTVYGDLDVCTIPDMPPGRQAVKTVVWKSDRWPEIVDLLRTTLERGEQAYVVAPRIDPDPSEEIDLRDAVTLHQGLKKQLGDAQRVQGPSGAGHTVGLLHGSLDSDQKNQAMNDFVSGRTAVLVATTVVEVGVDVPNATLMIVEHAERFGLAQLHQLRGRVGRGAAPAECVLVAHPPLTPVARARLQALLDHQDGFELAEQDLLLRGPGEVLGTRQAGALGLRLGDPVRDHEWLVTARQEAARLLAADDPEASAFIAMVRNAWRRSLRLLRAG